MKFLSLLILYLIPFASMAGTFPDLTVKSWHPGEAWLNSGERLKGKIYYEIDKELILVFYKDKIKTYSSNQIDKFSIVEDSGQERFFHSISLVFDGATRRNYFFEIMARGHLVYLRKQRSRADGFGMFFFNETLTPGYAGLFDYYFLLNDNLVKIKRFKKDALKWMDDHQEKMNVFIDKNGLHLRKLEDQVRLLKYYNTLCEEEAIANDRRY